MDQSMIGVVKSFYQIFMLAAAILIPIIIIKYVASKGQVGGIEDKRMARQNLRQIMNIILIFLIFPAIFGVLWSLLTKSITMSSISPLNQQQFSVSILPSTAASVYSIVYGLFSWIAIGMQNFVRNTITMTFVPAIAISEQKTFFSVTDGGTRGGTGGTVWGFWSISLGVSLVVIFILVLVDYFKEVFAVATDQQSDSGNLGSGIMTVLSRILIAFTLCLLSYPISRGIIYFGEQLYSIVAKSIIGTNKTFFGNYSIAGIGDKLDYATQEVFDIVNQKNTLNPIASATFAFSSYPWSKLIHSVLIPTSKFQQFLQGILHPLDTIVNLKTATIATLPDALLILFLSSYSAAIVLSIAALFAMRFIMLALLVILSPIVFSGLASQFSQNGFKNWLNKMIVWSIFPAITLLIMSFGYVLVQSFIGSLSSLVNPTQTTIQAFYILGLMLIASVMIVILKLPSILTEVLSGITDGMEEPSSLIQHVLDRKGGAK